MVRSIAHGGVLYGGVLFGGVLFLGVSSVAGRGGWATGGARALALCCLSQTNKQNWEYIAISNSKINHGANCNQRIHSRKPLLLFPTIFIIYIYTPPSSYYYYYYCCY